jgi:hypothetical protein
MKNQERYCLTASAQFHIDPFPRVHAAVLPSIAIARHWLMLITANEAMVINGRRMKLLMSGIEVESPQLLEIFSYRRKDDDPCLDDQHYKWLCQFRRGRWHESPAVERVASDATVTPRAAKPERPRRPEEYITVASLVAGTDLSPMQARGILRLSEKKPEHGWAWPPKEVPRIKKLLALR